MSEGVHTLILSMSQSCIHSQRNILGKAGIWVKNVLGIGKNVLGNAGKSWDLDPLRLWTP